MNLLFIFSYAYILRQLLKQKYYNDGCDERYIWHLNYFNDEDDDKALEKIIRIKQIESDLNLLQSDNISIDDKLHFLNDNNSILQPIKMTNGGLMDDFLFKFPLD
jgi:hypothetical protein